MNLIDDAWIPVLKDGAPASISLSQIASPGVTAIHGLPADLHIGVLEMLIAMFTMALTTPDIDTWHDMLETPPSAEHIRAAFSPYRAGFEVLGDGPRFMQMPCPQTPTELKKASPISALMWGAAGGNTVKKNLDIVVHRDETGTLPPAMAAIALYSDLTRIQGAGAGHLSNIRKSNHITVLLDLSDQHPDHPLWATIWGNVPCLEKGPLSANAMEDALPWMRQSQIGSGRADLGSASLQTRRPDIERYFATPRRIWLLEDGAGRVNRFLRKARGFRYDDEEWSHPHSPYVRVKTSGSNRPPAPYKVAAERFPRLGAYELVEHAAKQVEAEAQSNEIAEFTIPALQRARQETDLAGGGLKVIVAHQLADIAEMMSFSVDLGTHVPGDPAEALALLEHDRVVKRAYTALEIATSRLLAGSEAWSIPPLPSAFSTEQALIQFTDQTRARFRKLSLEEMTSPEGLRGWSRFVAAAAEGIFREMFFETALHGPEVQTDALLREARRLRKLYPEKDRQTEKPQKADLNAHT